MNLKNSKFFKRIQHLRRISTRVKCTPRTTCIEGKLISAFKEKEFTVQDAGVPYVQENSAALLQKESANTQRGIILLNNVCYHMKCDQPEENEKPVATKKYGHGIPDIKINKESICVTNSRYAVIASVSKSLGFKLVKEMKLWNILWTDSLPSIELYKSMKRFQQINHFPGMMEICRKDLLSRNLNRMLKLYPRDYNIFPRTWIFPADYGDALAFSNKKSIKSKNRTFIIKPDAGAQGRGIWLTTDLKSINPSERMICQLYISRPLLIDGYKFDLRVYTLITSIDPLRIFVYNEGLARFATNKYCEPSTTNHENMFMHLTNYSVNKHSSSYSHSIRETEGSKRKFSSLNKWLILQGYNVGDMWRKIDDIIIKTVLSAWPMLKHNYNACFPTHDTIQACFEILGVDILVDAKLNPYILEVNHSPSFHTNEPVDREVKRALIRDTLTLVSAALADKRQIIREDRKRIRRRLLTKRRTESSSAADVPSRQCDDATDNHTNSESNVRLSPLNKQIAWEESHLGDFRRIMPPPADVGVGGQSHYYCQFFDLQNQSSIYSETASSKRREQVAKEQRLVIDEKYKVQLLLHRRKKQPRDLVWPRRRRGGQALAEKNRKIKWGNLEKWAPTFISEGDERVRQTLFAERKELIHSSNIFQLIFQIFYENDNLTESDIDNCPQLYDDLKQGTPI